VLRYGACRDQQQHREIFNPAREIEHEPPRHRIRPVRVVDHDRHRRPRAQIRRQPIQAMHRCRDRIVGTGNRISTATAQPKRAGS
jgi:hypothetical protein